MEVEPEVPRPRESEALLVVVDSFSSPASPVPAFQSLRDAAMRMARTRLIYSVLKDDLIAVIKSGSNETSNKLALENPGGYKGIEVLHPPTSRSLDAVRALAELTQGTAPSNLIDVLDVCGDTLSEQAVGRAKKKRVVLFTDGGALCKSVVPEYVPELVGTCELYAEQEIQVDVICYCNESTAETLQALEEEVAELEGLSVSELMDRASQFELSFLFVVCKATGGVLMSYKDASSLVDKPTPKVKRAMAKYRGTLNIANILKIPVKRFSCVGEATHVTGKKISWDASAKRKEPVPVLVETQRVASAKDDSPLEPNDIVNAYPYGPELVPEQNEVDTYAWSMHLPKGLDVLGFVDQSSVPHRLFMGRVDVVIAMPGVDGADRLMKSLVIAMEAEKLGILARSVAPARGGAPQLAFLWPRVEVARENGALRNFFLFMVEVPMREDIRDLPFATLADATDEVPENANRAMHRYITSTLLESDGVGREEDEEDEDEEDFLWPPNVSNPNLDWFNICVVHRALAGIAGTDFPPLSVWHRQLIDPTSFISERNRNEFDKAIQELKTALPVIPAKRKEKKGKRVHEALNGDFASIVDYLPQEMVDADGDAQDQDEDSLGERPQISADLSDTESGVTDFDVIDVGDETPVADFQALVKKNKFGFAAVSILVVVRRLIRDVVDDDKALRCLRALRIASIEMKEPRFFNDFIISLVARCNREDSVGNRTAAFLRHSGRRGETASAIDVIPVAKPKSSESETPGDLAYKAFLEDISSQIANIVSKEGNELSTSAISRP